MAKPVSEEELQLRKRARRRLIGAIVLVAVVAAILPMVLDSEPKPTSQEINIQIPSPDAKGSFTSKVVPVPAPSGKDGAATKPESKAPASAVTPAVAEKPALPVPDGQKEAVVTPPSKPIPGKGTTAAPEKALENAVAPKVGPGTFFIQVVALAEAEKAKQVQKQIVDAGIRAYTEVVAAGNAKVTRVRAGPFATREEAERARTTLQGIGLEGKVAAN
jgi:DedD protein